MTRVNTLDDDSPCLDCLRRAAWIQGWMAATGDDDETAAEEFEKWLDEQEPEN